MALRKYLPPILLELVHRARQMRVYVSFTEALAQCDNGGYEQANLCNVVKKKTEILRDRYNPINPIVMSLEILRLYFALCVAKNTTTLNVIDLGGACGIHYFSAKALFSDKVKLAWHVVETPGMVAVAKSLETDELKFYSDINSAKSGMDQIDIIFVSSVLSYVPEPYNMLIELLDVGANHVFLTRQPLTHFDKDIFQIQESRISANGPGPLPAGMVDGTARYPMTAIRKSKVESILQDKYHIRISSLETQNAFWILGQGIHEYGYLASKKTFLAPESLSESIPPSVQEM